MMFHSPELPELLPDINERHEDSSRWKRTGLHVEDQTGKDGWSKSLCDWQSGDPLTSGAVMGAILDRSLVHPGQTLRFQLRCLHARSSNQFKREFAVLSANAASPGVDPDASTAKAVVQSYSGNVNALSGELLKTHELVRQVLDESMKSRALSLDEREKAQNKTLEFVREMGNWLYLPATTVMMASSMVILKKSDLDPMAALSRINEVTERAEKMFGVFKGATP